MPNKNLHENKLKRAMAVPFRRLVKALSKTEYVKLQYRYITHHKCNLNDPVRYTEKLQFLRLYVWPKDPEVSRCAGRVGVRDYVSECGYADSLIPIYGVYDRFEDIDFEKLPDSFAMKCSHACAFNELVHEKSKMDLDASKKKFDRWLATDYGKKTVELHYSRIKPQIIIEKLIGNMPTEYKIHVFNGKARYMYVVTGRGADIRYNNYYVDWTPFDGAQFNGWKKTDYPLAKPKEWDSMVKMAEDLASRFPFCRVDLYDVDGKVYFGEMTFTPAKGTLILDDDKADFEIGKWLDISKYVSAR